MSRGDARVYMKDYDKAIDDYSEAIRLDPKFIWGFNGLAWIRATCPDAKYRDGKKAVESGTRACGLSDWNNAKCIETLAAAYAEAGNFAKAVEFQEKANKLYPDEAYRKQGKERLTLYREKKPYREKG